jgi:hypothetical protein
MTEEDMEQLTDVQRKKHGSTLGGPYKGHRFSAVTALPLTCGPRPTY